MTFLGPALKNTFYLERFARKLSVSTLFKPIRWSSWTKLCAKYQIHAADIFSFLNGKSIKCIKMAYQILVRPKVHIYHVQYMSFSFEDVILLL